MFRPHILEQYMIKFDQHNVTTLVIKLFITIKNMILLLQGRKNISSEITSSELLTS